MIWRSFTPDAFPDTTPKGSGLFGKELTSDLLFAKLICNPVHYGATLLTEPVEVLISGVYSFNLCIHVTFTTTKLLSYPGYSHQSVCPSIHPASQPAIHLLPFIQYSHCDINHWFAKACFEGFNLTLQLWPFFCHLDDSLELTPVSKCYQTWIAITATVWVRCTDN